MSTHDPLTKTVSIGDRAINLTQVLKLAGCAESGGAAKALIAAGHVQVNGQAELRKRCQMKAGDTIVIDGGPTILLTVGGQAVE
jgi:ribosome-associated protein